MADLQRDFNAFIDEAKIGYKAFYNQLAKPGFFEMMLSLTLFVIKQLTFNVLGFREDSPFRRFTGIQVHDGSSFALKDALAEILRPLWGRVVSLRLPGVSAYSPTLG